MALVTATGVSKTDGTSTAPLLTLPLRVEESGVFPWASVTASEAAASASALIAL